MKAVIMGKDGGVEVVDIDVPRAGRGELVVRMEACGLCGTDVEKIEGGYRASRPVIGHEAAGIVAEVGEGVKGFEVGDRVVPHHHVPCYSCYYCLNGSPTMCPSYREFNFDPGGFAEYFRVPSWIVSHGGVFKVTEEVSMDVVSLTEPTACCIRALERARFREGERVLVVGSGPVGLTFIQLLNHMGARKVLAADLSDYRLRAAERYGAIPINVKEADPRMEVMAETDGIGVDLAIIAAGSISALLSGLNSVRKGGRVCLFGVLPIGSKSDYDLSNLITNELTIISSNAATEAEMRKALDLICEGCVDVEGIITHRYPLTKFEEALRTFRSLNSLKILIKPT